MDGTFRVAETFPDHIYVVVTASSGFSYGVLIYNIPDTADPAVQTQYISDYINSLDVSPKVQRAVKVVDAVATLANRSIPIVAKLEAVLDQPVKGALIG